MSESKHTPGKLERFNIFGEAGGLRRLRAVTGPPILECKSPPTQSVAVCERTEDAAFIVLAWNCHDDLLEALKAVNEYFWNPDHEPGGLRESDVCDLVTAAIAKANRSG